MGGQSIRIRSLRRLRSRRALRSVTSRPIFPARHQLGLGEAEVRRHHPAVDRVDRPRLALEDVAERRLAVRVGVEVVGEIPLRIGVDRHHVHAEALEDVRQRADHRRLPGAALLGQDRNRLGHLGGLYEGADAAAVAQTAN